MSEKQSEGVEDRSGAPLKVHRLGRGRPTKYQDGFAIIAKRLCELGATDADLADEFGVSTVTIWRWQSQHPDFCNAVRVGKDAADDLIERSLFQRARGYTFSTFKIMQDKGQPVVVEHMEHVPPDLGAMKLWLTNRRGDKWREKTEHTHKADEAFLALWQKMSGGQP